MATATRLRSERLLTSSLRHEPQFKHAEVDDPDCEAVDALLARQPKKARKVLSFDFARLLPLPLSRDEVRLARDVGRVVLRRAGGATLNSSAPCSTSNADASTAATDVFKVTTTWDIIDASDASSDASDTASSPPEMTEEERKLINGLGTPERARVFREMWRLGWTLVDGMKFGADWLAYIDDPLRTHANFAVLFVQNPQASCMSLLDLTCLCTVAAKTRKLALAAYVDPATDSVRFMELTRRAVNLPRKFGGAATAEEALLDEIPALPGEEEGTTAAMDDDVAAATVVEMMAD